MIRKIKKIINKFGIDIVRYPPKTVLPRDFRVKNFADQKFINIYNECKKYTMTGIEKMYALYEATKYIVNNNIPGDFVECGVWKGGSTMLIAITLKEMGVEDRRIYLYDTFEGMTPPEDIDKSIRGGTADEWLKKSDKMDDRSVWCYSPIEEVRNNMGKTKYPADKIKYVKGRVEETIPNIVPQKISLLRLDTDWFKSTYHELVHMYPLVSPKGILIIDDYGHWSGCRGAVDKYFAENNIFPLLNRIDYAGRIVIKD